MSVRCLFFCLGWWLRASPIGGKVSFLWHILDLKRNNLCKQGPWHPVSEQSGAAFRQGVLWQYGGGITLGTSYRSWVLAGRGLEEVIFHQCAPLPPWRVNSPGPHKEVSCIIICLLPVRVLAGVIPLKVVLAKQGSCAFLYPPRQETSGSFQPHGHGQSCIGTGDADQPADSALLLWESLPESSKPRMPRRAWEAILLPPQGPVPFQKSTLPPWWAATPDYQLLQSVAFLTAEGLLWEEWILPCFVMYCFFKQFFFLKIIWFIVRWEILT